MATIITATPPALLTYEAYMAEPEVAGRYDIINGVRIFMAGGTWKHQRISQNISRLFADFEDKTGIGLTVSAPFDVLIRKTPKLQTRQPDVLFVSHARLAQGRGIPEIGPLDVAPELVVEIISTSETARIIGDKIADYASAGVDEVWVIRPDAKEVERLTLQPSSNHASQIFRATQHLTSSAFPQLTVRIDDVFLP